MKLSIWLPASSSGSSSSGSSGRRRGEAGRVHCASPELAPEPAALPGRQDAGLACRATWEGAWRGRGWLGRAVLPCAECRLPPADWRAEVKQTLPRAMKQQSAGRAQGARSASRLSCGPHSWPGRAAAGRSVQFREGVGLLPGRPPLLPRRGAGLRGLLGAEEGRPLPVVSPLCDQRPLSLVPRARALCCHASGAGRVCEHSHQFTSSPPPPPLA